MNPSSPTPDDRCRTLLPRIDRPRLSWSVFALSLVGAVACFVFGKPPLLWAFVIPAMAAPALLLLLSTTQRFSLGDILVSAFSFVRYVVVPTANAIWPPAPLFPVQADSHQHDLACLMLAWECLVVLGGYVILRSKLRGSAGLPRRGLDNPTIVPRIPLISLIVVGCGIKALTIWDVRRRFTFFMAAVPNNTREIFTSYDWHNTHWASVAILTRVLVPVLVIGAMVRLSRWRESWLWPAVSLGVLAASVSFYPSYNRANVLIPLVAGICVILTAFPRYRKPLLILGAVAGTMMLGVITLQKTFRSASAAFSSTSQLLALYGLGPREYAIGMEALHTYGVQATPRTFMNDLFANMPFFVPPMELTDRTTQFYNWTFVHPDLIIGGSFIEPASIQGAFYLGSVLGVLQPLAVICLLVYVESRRCNGSRMSAVQLFASYYATMVLGIYWPNSIGPTLAMLALPVFTLVVADALDSVVTNSIGRRSARVQS